MRVAGISDVGKVRLNNEDCLLFGELSNAAYAIVCDGMGGAEGGEIASRIAVETIQSQIENAYSPKMSVAAMERMLLSAFTAANYKVYEYAQANALMGMGTTAVAAIMTDTCCIIAYVGDSRAYILGEEIRQLTVDHTYVNELYKLGEITKEEMETDPRKNIITRALGVGEEVLVDSLTEDVAEGDTILLCSDGLTNCLSDPDILDIYHSHSFEDASQIMVDKANENGGVDNQIIYQMISL